MRKGSILIILGLLLFAAALGMFGVNMVRDIRMTAKLTDVLAQLSPEIDAAALNAPEPLSREELSSVTKRTKVPYYQLSPLAELPSVEVDGEEYVGILFAPSAAIELPILRRSDSGELPAEPCVFQGTPYQEHFYLSVSGQSRQMKALTGMHTGAVLWFTDTDGNRFEYTVAELLQLSPEDISENTQSEWPLTVYVFTDSSSLLAIGCERR